MVTLAKIGQYGLKLVWNGGRTDGISFTEVTLRALHSTNLHYCDIKIMQIGAVYVLYDDH